jgi:hypothetical protein
MWSRLLIHDDQRVDCVVGDDVESIDYQTCTIPAHVKAGLKGLTFHCYVERQIEELLRRIL